MEASRCANMVIGVVVDTVRVEVKERAGWLAGIVRANYASLARTAWVGVQGHGECVANAQCLRPRGVVHVWY